MRLINSVSVACIFVITAFFSSRAIAEVSDRLGSPLQVDRQADRLLIKQDTLPVATYVFRDSQIHRPYFANVYTPGGLPVTRHHPPRPALDATDHDTMHPGIWFAFGDISGQDFWRNKGRVEHLEFVDEPKAAMNGQEGIVSFTVRNRYVADKTVCHELFRHTLRATKDGYLFMLDSEFSSSEPFHFGDQEEMGLGLRLATPLIVKGGTGTITSSDGAKNEKQVWGQQALWCDYSGILTTKAQPAIPRQEDRRQQAGMLLVPHPKNFRPSWLHARDYGLVVANPFGQRTFTKGPASRFEIRPGGTLRLRFGVWAYNAKENEKVDFTALAADYVRLAH